MDQLGHGAAFVRAVGNVLQDGGVGRQVAVGDVIRHVGGGRSVGVEAVREDADLDARAVDSEAGARRGGVLGGIRLAGHQSDVRHRGRNPGESQIVVASVGRAGQHAAQGVQVGQRDHPGDDPLETLAMNEPRAGQGGEQRCPVPVLGGDIDRDVGHAAQCLHRPRKATGGRAGGMQVELAELGVEDREIAGLHRAAETAHGGIRRSRGAQPSGRHRRGIASKLQTARLVHDRLPMPRPPLGTEGAIESSLFPANPNAQALPYRHPWLMPVLCLGGRSEAGLVPMSKHFRAPMIASMRITREIGPHRGGLWR